MNPREETSGTRRDESDFSRLLREVLENQASLEMLLEDPLFKSKLRLITMAHARTTQEAEELANDVRIKVSQKLQHFQPDYRNPYGSFFSWLRTLTRKLYQQRIVNLDSANTQTDMETSVLYKQVKAEFEKIINALPEKERLAIAYYLQGFSLKETSEKMLQAGFSASQGTVTRWIRDVLRAFWESGTLENIKSKNVRVTKVRATRAKKEFRTILDQAINSGTPAITPEGIYGSKGTQPGWASANDLLQKMQSPESKQGVQDAFKASPKELGRAAVEHVNKGRKVPVSSLTYIMAASTVNVVGRVMNLTKDAT